jgi:hypothetical protein
MHAARMKNDPIYVRGVVCVCECAGLVEGIKIASAFYFPKSPFAIKLFLQKRRKFLSLARSFACSLNSFEMIALHQQTLSILTHNTHCEGGNNRGKLRAKVECCRLDGDGV